MLRLLCGSLLWGLVCGTLREDAERLRTEILMSMARETILPPRPDLVVAAAFQLNRILHLDEMTGEMEVQGRVLLVWRDPDASWRPVDYGNLTYLPVPQASIWTPPLLFISAGAQIPVSYEPEPVIVSKDGTCELIRSVKLRLFLGEYRRSRYSTLLLLYLRGRENAGLRLEYLQNTDRRHRYELPIVLPPERYGSISPVWSVEKALPALSLYSQHNIAYELVVVRKNVGWSELLAIRAVGLAAALFFAFVFSLERAERAHLRFFGLLAALLLQAATELLARSFAVLQAKSLPVAELESLREVILLSGWALCVAEACVIWSLLQMHATYLAQPLSSNIQCFLAPLFHATCQRPIKHRLVPVSKVKRAVSTVSTVSGLPSMRPGNLYIDSGLGSEASGPSPFAHSVSAEISLLNDPPMPNDWRTSTGSYLGEERALLGNVRSGDGLEAGYPVPPPGRLYIRSPPPPSGPCFNLNGDSTPGVRGMRTCRPPSSVLSCCSAAELGSSTSKLWLRRHALLAIDRLFPLLLAPAALLFLYSTS